MHGIKSEKGRNRRPSSHLLFHVGGPRQFLHEMLLVPRGGPRPVHVRAVVHGDGALGRHEKVHVQRPSAVAAEGRKAGGALRLVVWVGSTREVIIGRRK